MTTRADAPGGIPPDTTATSNSPCADGSPSDAEDTTSTSPLRASGFASSSATSRGSTAINTLDSADLAPMETLNCGPGSDVIGTFDQVVDRERSGVLIVEDHALVSQGLLFMLSQAGVRATTFAGGDVVEEALDAGGVALLDLELGELGDGADLVGALTERGVAVIVLTGVTDRLRHAVCVERGAHGVLSKSASFDEALEAVRAVLRGERLMGMRVRDELIADLRAHREAEERRLAPFAHLTRRETAVLAGIVRGQRAREMAREACVSIKTIRSQIASVLLKLGVPSQLAAAALVAQSGWTGDEVVADS
jgi:DNA-binding NarL/FixJ family response regulator